LVAIHFLSPVAIAIGMAMLPRAYERATQEEMTSAGPDARPNGIQPAPLRRLA
jgi:hypothetical protein